MGNCSAEKQTVEDSVRDSQPQDSLSMVFFGVGEVEYPVRGAVYPEPGRPGLDMDRSGYEPG